MDTRAIPLKLTVRDFALPDVPSLGTMIALGQGDLNMRHLGEQWPVDPAKIETSILIANRHFQLAHRHKLSLVAIEGATADKPGDEWLSRLDGSLFTAQNGYDGPGLGVGLDVFTIGLYGSWDWQDEDMASMQSHADSWVTWFDSNAPDTEYFLYLIDESLNYPQIEQWAEWIETSAGPGSSLLSFATMNLLDARTSAPSLDIAATVSSIKGLPTDWQETTDYYISAPDKRLYFYNGVRPWVGSFATEDDGVALRSLAWAQYKLKIDRWFFWSCNYYNNYQLSEGQTNVFRTAKTYGRTERFDEILGETGTIYSNGDGVLLYPGTDLVYPEDSYGVNGPIAGIRMKLWRRGIQDGDYLTLAAAIDAAAVQGFVERILPLALWEYEPTVLSDPTWVRTDISWSIDPDDWEEARTELADIIEQGK